MVQGLMTAYGRQASKARFKGYPLLGGDGWRDQLIGGGSLCQDMFGQGIAARGQLGELCWRILGHLDCCLLLGWDLASTVGGSCVGGWGSHSFGCGLGRGLAGATDGDGIGSLDLGCWPIAWNSCRLWCRLGCSHDTGRRGISLDVLNGVHLYPP